MKRLTIVLSDDGKVTGACVDDATREAFALTALTLPAELADLNAAAIEQATQSDAAISAANAAKDKEVAAIKAESEVALAAVNREKSDLVASHTAKLTEVQEKAKSDLQSLADTHTGIQSESAASQATKIAALEDSLREETATKQQAIAALIEHQRISDVLANRAAAAMESGDIAALPAIIEDAKLFGAAREKVKLEEQIAAKKVEIATLEEKLAAMSSTPL